LSKLNSSSFPVGYRAGKSHKKLYYSEGYWHLGNMMMIENGIILMIFTVSDVLLVTVLLLLLRHVYK